MDIRYNYPFKLGTNFTKPGQKYVNLLNKKLKQSMAAAGTGD